MIELRQVVVSYRSGVRVGPLDLRLDPGELVLVNGPNGAGKTTLIELLAGRLRPNSGTVIRPPRRGALAVLPQHLQFTDQVPVRVEDLVGFASLAGGWPRGAGRGRVAAALERAGAAELAGRLVRELSGGQRQLVQVARLLAQRADYWLLDEPLAGLAPEWRRRVLGLLDSVHREEGTGMLLVSHLHDERPSGCRRILVVDGGRVADDGLSAMKPNEGGGG